MYENLRVNVKVERGSTFTFTRGFSYIVSILFTHVKPVKVYVRTLVKITRQWKSTFTRGFSYIVSILVTHVKPVKSLRPYARKNYATVEYSCKPKSLIVCLVE